MLVDPVRMLLYNITINLVLQYNFLLPPLILGNPWGIGGLVVGTHPLYYPLTKAKPPDPHPLYYPLTKAKPQPAAPPSPLGYFPSECKPMDPFPQGYFPLEGKSLDPSPWGILQLRASPWIHSPWGISLPGTPPRPLAYLVYSLDLSHLKSCILILEHNFLQIRHSSLE